jgi:hypothetical protein
MPLNMNFKIFSHKNIDILKAINPIALGRRVDFQCEISIFSMIFAFHICLGGEPSIHIQSVGH